MAVRDVMALDDLSDLRQQSLRVVLLCTLGWLYLWVGILFHLGDNFGLAWGGPILLIVGLAFALINQKRNTSLAAAALIGGVAIANLYIMLLKGMDMTAYVLAIVAGLAGLLFGLRAVIWVTVLCSGLIIGVGTLRWGYPAFSTRLLGPMLVVSAVGTLSSLGVRNLYETLYWFRDRATAAQRNQETLRRRQAQLARTLKALDEAYGRLEYLNYDLARAREAAEKARGIKQRFVTTVSHELRTPLNVVVALSELMYLSPQRYDMGPFPPTLRGDVRELYRSSKHLLHLIDDVLLMSQVEAGRLKIDQQPIELHQVVRETLDMIRPLVHEERVALRSEVPNDLPRVSADRDRLQQVLLNLLNNARRFTTLGSITVEAVLEDEKVRVTVADTGVGISPHEQDKVFKEFQQLEGIAGRHDGSGLGLAISRRFIEVQGGRIWVESDGVPGHGSRFHFTLPIIGSEQVEVSRLQGERKPIPSPNGHGRTLLLVGQDASAANIIEQGLDNYTLIPVSDISQVPAQLEEQHIRAVVLTTTAGEQACQQLRDLRGVLNGTSVPIVLCPVVAQHQQGQALGAADYLVKPVTQDALLDALDREANAAQQVLIIDDDPRMVRLLARMLQATDRPYEVIHAYGGQEGLQHMRSQQPDAVLLDLFMPQVDGYQVLAEMKEDEALRDIPVVVITAQGRTPQEERQLGGGMMCLSSGIGFTNAEAVAYLQSIIDAAAPPAPLRRPRQVVEQVE